MARLTTLAAQIWNEAAYRRIFATLFFTIALILATSPVWRFYLSDRLGFLGEICSGLIR